MGETEKTFKRIMSSLEQKGVKKFLIRLYLGL